MVVVSKPRRKIPRIRFGPVQPISLTTENWNAVEAAYGRSLSEEVRSQILQVTNQFLQFADAEKNIGDMDEALQRAAGLRECAQRLVDSISERPVDDVTREYVDDEIALQYSRLKIDDERFAKRFPARGWGYVTSVSLEVNRFVTACDKALQVLEEASQHNYWPVGGAWDVWIRDLTHVLEAHDLRTGASKDTDKRPDRTSSFTSFVMTLQTFLPNEHVRSRQAGALAGAIHKARREKKPLAVPRAASPPKAGRNTKNSAP